MLKFKNMSNYDVSETSALNRILEDSLFISEWGDKLNQLKKSAPKLVASLIAIREMVGTYPIADIMNFNILELLKELNETTLEMEIKYTDPIHEDGDKSLWIMNIGIPAWKWELRTINNGIETAIKNLPAEVQGAIKDHPHILQRVLAGGVVTQSNSMWWNDVTLEITRTWVKILKNTQDS